MNNALVALSNIFLNVKSLFSAVSLGSFSLWDLFLAFWLFGIIVGAIGFLFKLKGGK